MRTDTVGSLCGDKEKEVDNTLVQMEMVQVEDACFVKERLGIGSSSVHARLVQFGRYGGEGRMAQICCLACWFCQYTEAGADLAAVQKFDADVSKKARTIHECQLVLLFHKLWFKSKTSTLISDEHTLSEQN